MCCSEERTVDRHRYRIDQVAPLAKSLLDRVRADLARVARGVGRAAFELDRSEIERELDMVEAMIRRRDAGGAARLLGECMVNRALLARGRTAPEQWLDYGSVREPAGRALHRVAEANVAVKQLLAADLPLPSTRVPGQLRLPRHDEPNARNSPEVPMTLRRQ